MTKCVPIMVFFIAIVSDGHTIEAVIDNKYETNSGVCYLVVIVDDDPYIVEAEPELYLAVARGDVVHVKYSGGQYVLVGR